MSKKKNKYYLILILLFGVLSVFGQNGFSYKRKLKGIHNEWHQVYIPTDLYPNSNPDFSDIRIQAYSQKGDTFNVPYILEEVKRIQIEQQVSFKIINESYRNDWYYFTLVCPTDVMVNNLHLEFAEENFDWHVNLDAAEKLGEWVAILDDVRIISFHNKEASYQFSKLRFRDSKFPYYRVSIHGAKKPGLKSVKLSYYEDKPGSNISYQLKSFTVTEDKLNKQTLLDFKLQDKLPVHSISLFPKTRSDYFRKMQIEYLSDSVYSDAKWQHLYQTLTTAYISSDDYELYSFSPVKADRFRIRIFNNDDEPVKFESVQVFGPQHRLILRIPDQNSDYYLLYGNKKMKAPVYDLINFKSKIPDDLDKLFLGPEIKGDFIPEENTAPPVPNKIWLWVVLIAMVLLLFYFSFKMLKQEKK